MIRQRCHSSPRGGTGGGEGVWWRDDNYNDYNNYDGHVNGDGQEQRRGYIRRQGTQTHERFYGGGLGRGEDAHERDSASHEDYIGHVACDM